MTKLALYSGGLLFDAKKIDDLRPAFQKVAQELSSQYSIGFYPKNLKHDGKFHKVEMKTKKPGLLVRNKQGYFALP